jgi:ParB-like chromosome segregation protein Spo0J
MATRLDLQKAASYRPDDNALTYRPDLDGRNADGERLQFVPLRLIHPSPHQTRLVRDQEADRLLAEDIDAKGFLHAPVVRPHPTVPGAYETVAGHRRVDVGWLLAREGRGDKILRGQGADPGERCLGVVVRPMDDLEASGRTIAENHLRAGLRPWEEGRALQRFKAMLAAAGEASSTRAVAASLDLHRSTLAPYLQVAERLTPEVRAMAADASMFPGLDPVPTDDATLCRLPLEALQRAARAKTLAARARCLHRELSRLVKTDPPESIQTGDVAAAAPASERGVQINIRRPLGSLSAAQAERHLEKFAETSLILFDRANAGQPSLRKSASGSWMILVPDLKRLDEAAADELVAALNDILVRLASGG